MSQIDKGVPLPSSARGRKKSPAIPFADFEIGDSWFESLDKRKAATVRIKLMVRARAALPHATFETRVVVEKEIVGIRIWRVA